MEKVSEGTISQRLNMVVDTFEKGVKIALAHKIGFSTQAVHDMLSGKRGAPSFKALSGIIENYPQVRAEWLLTGNGEMLKEGQILSLAPQSQSQQSQSSQVQQNQQAQIEVLQGQVLRLEAQVQLLVQLLSESRK